MGEKKYSNITGTQSAAKVLQLLRMVGSHHATGIRLSDLVELSGIDKSTAHRLLQCMLEEGFVERIGASKAYRLGMESLQWGFSSAGMEALSEKFRPTLLRLARITDDAVFLMVRSGDYVVCLSRVEGGHPTKAYVVEVGVRRLLGASACGISMLAQMSDDEVQGVLSRHEAEYARSHLSVAGIRKVVLQARAAGYSEVADMRIDSGGVGCAFPMTENCWAGLSVAIARHRCSPERLQHIGSLLLSEVAQVS